MSSTDLIDRIVANVLTQLSPGAKVAAPVAVQPVAKVPVPVAEKIAVAVSLQQRVVTAELIEAVAKNQAVIISPKSIITPAAWDAIRERNLKLERGTVAEPAKANASTSKSEQKPPAGQGLLIVVKSTQSAEKLFSEAKSGWRRELLGCPDDAAKLAIAELSRGACSQVVILCEQSLRAACLANRSDKVKAAPVSGAGDVRMARRQLKVNTWCLDPSPLSYFELRNILKAITDK